MGAPGDRGLLQQRREIIAFLRSQEAPRLPRIDRETVPPEKAGTVSVNFDDGYLLFVPQGEALQAGQRLVWRKGEKNKTCALAPGEYQIRRAVIRRTDDQGTEWYAMATGEGRTVTIRPNMETKLLLNLDVRLKNNSHIGKGQVILGGSFSGDHGMGLSLVEGPSRILPRWKVSIKGQEIVQGECSYG